MAGKTPTTPATAGSSDPRALLTAAAQETNPEEVRVFLFRRSGADFAVERLKTTEALADEFAVVATTWARELRSRTIVRYSAGRTPSEHELASLSAQEVPGFVDLVRSLEGDVDLPTFSIGGSVSQKLTFYVVSLRRSNPGWIHFFRAKSSRSLRLSRSRKIAALFTGELFDQVTEDPLLFDQSFDAVSDGADILMTNQRNFEKSLDFLSDARDAAEATLRSATKNLPVANLDEFLAAAAADINMISKIRSITEKMARNAEYAKALTRHRLLGFAALHPSLELDLEGPPGKEKLVFHNDPQRRWRILKILDDDYLHSQLTEFDYEVNSKDFL
ncbi:MAG: DUF4868 domain-containing protein [Actinomycetota bacterium]|nr:DUF4868 domain-containing protein [Actinomycetota bacterium]